MLSVAKKLLSNDGFNENIEDEIISIENQIKELQKKKLELLCVKGYYPSKKVKKLVDLFVREIESDTLHGGCTSTIVKGSYLAFRHLEIFKTREQVKLFIDFISNLGECERKAVSIKGKNYKCYVIPLEVYNALIELSKE